MELTQVARFRSLQKFRTGAGPRELPTSVALNELIPLVTSYSFLPGYRRLET